MAIPLMAAAFLTFGVFAPHVRRPIYTALARPFLTAQQLTG